MSKINDDLINEIKNLKEKLKLLSSKGESFKHFQNEEKEGLIDELALEKKELVLQSEKNDDLIDELALAKKELAFQKEIEERADELATIKVELEQQNSCLNEAAIVSETDANFKITFVSDKFCELYGYHREELMGQDHRILKSGKQPDVFFTNMISTISSGKVWKSKILNKKKDGGLYWMDITIMPFKDLTGKIIKHVAIMFDINSQTVQKDILLKQTEQLAIANKERAFQNREIEKRADELALLIDTANAPIFGIDSKGLVNEWNQTSEKITGFTKDEVLGNDLVQTYITEDYRESVKHVLDDALKGKETANYEFPLFAKDGERVMVLLNSSTRRSVNGKINGVLGVGQDITELVGYRNDLELKVNQRTLKLNAALKKEKELSELKSRFVSIASHEFRTPLSAINFAAGSMKKYWARMEAIMIEKKLTKIEDQVAYMVSLLDDVLLVGQAEAGEMKNHPLALNLEKFISEIIEEVYESSKKSHKITLIDSEQLKKNDIYIDEKLGRNIFINLLSNAIKFSPDADKVIVELSSEKDYTIISVIDFGLGIPESEIEKIFMPFTRGENVDSIQGTGLGLSIVKEALAAMGGKIIVNSTLGNGTTFMTKIPKKQL
jgi:PAS domain S-box-containing protein